MTLAEIRRLAVEQESVCIVGGSQHTLARAVLQLVAVAAAGIRIRSKLTDYGFVKEGETCASDLAAFDAALAALEAEG